MDFRGLYLGWILAKIEVLGPGTSHITLLPPPIAYGGSEGHELENSWLRFEVELTLLAAI